MQRTIRFEFGKVIIKAEKDTLFSFINDLSCAYMAQAELAEDLGAFKVAKDYERLASEMYDICDAEGIYNE